MGLKTRSWASAAIVTAMLVTFLGIAAYPAYADPPVIFKLEVDETFTLADCGTFLLLFSQVGTLTFQLFFNKDGDLVRVHNQFDVFVTYENSVTEKSISGPAHGPNIIDFERGTIVAVGLFFFGETEAGPILLDAGRIVLDLDTFEVIQLAGPKGVFGSEFGFAPLCDFLA